MYTKYNQVQKSITETACAKINLTLDVTGRRDDGYHTVRMIMETISIHDDLTITVSDEPGIRLTCEIADDRLSVGALSCGEDNLIVRAARRLLETAAETGRIDGHAAVGLDMHLIKRIPMAAGMAGGSTDAAAALRGINTLLSLGFSTDELCDISVHIGADVPYCIRGGSMLAEGIGEILTPIAAPPEAYLLIAKPQADVSTATVYRRIDSATDLTHPDTDGMIRAMEQGDLRGTASRLGNMLRDVTIADLPIVSDIEERMRTLGAAGALMSGSGPTVYGLYEDSDTCQKAYDALREVYPDIYISTATWRCL